MTGVVGLKPTYGRVTRRGVVPMSDTLDHCGPLAKVVADIALILNVVSGYDQEDPTSIDAPVPDYTDGLDNGVRGFRLGIDRTQFFSAHLTLPVRQAVDGALRVFQELGSVLIDVKTPPIDQAAVAGGILLMADVSSYHWNWLRARPSEYEPGTRRMLRLGELISARDYLLALQARRQFKTEMREVFCGHRLDAIVTPTNFGTAVPLAERFPAIAEPDDSIVEIKFNHHTMPFNLTGQQALTIPCGFSDAGLPVGMQIVGRPFDEATILRIGSAYERVTPWHKVSPSI
jgi:Asp-tRNA(Asn)/Glu-tRNA(Gln) amidotransferase A subunit family amidase